MKRILSIFIFILSLSVGILAQPKNQEEQQVDLARIYKAMDKGRKGEEIKIGVIGGSITAGTAASSTNKRWSNLMTDWWKVKFPNSKVTLINAGWGGTGSDIGVHRVNDDLLKQNPDFIVIEFAVNDVEGELAEKMMEGLAQQILAAENHPGVMILTLKMENGTTAQVSHKKVATHYGIPLVSFADSIDAQVAADSIALGSIFVDGLHPNDVGMAYIADFLKESLDSIYAYLPASENLPEIITELPSPLITDTYADTYQFFQNTIVPLQNSGWDIDADGWNCSIPGNQIDFQVTGNAFSLIFTQNISNNRGRAEVWVDEGDKVIIDAWMNEDWGTRSSFKLIQEGLTDGTHILHVRVISESSTSGNYVHVARLLAAGNVGSAAPIAKTSVYEKSLVNRVFLLNGTESFDPDGDLIDSYQWSIYSKPDGSEATINKSTDSIANFVPDKAGEYIINLMVKSGINESVPASKKVNVRATNSKPIAVAGNDTLSALNKYFRFDGTKSSDADGDLLTYKWVLESAPEGSATIIMKDDSEKPQCKFDVEGDYIISLIVSDSIDFSDKAFITVTGKEGYTAINNSSLASEDLFIYPNPSDNLINIEYFINNSQIAIAEIFTVMGGSVAKFNLTHSLSGLNKKTIRMKDYTTERGIYFLRLTIGNRIQTKRFTLI